MEIIASILVLCRLTYVIFFPHARTGRGRNLGVFLQSVSVYATLKFAFMQFSYLWFYGGRIRAALGNLAKDIPNLYVVIIYQLFELLCHPIFSVSSPNVSEF